MITVPVELAERRYEVVIGPGARHELGRTLAALGPAVERVAMVTQDPLRRAGWLEGLDPGVDFDVFWVPDGEEAKTLATVEGLCRGFARAGLARSDAVVAVGGGVVTDVAGFAAASYHRGVRYVNVATTLLAQVDAAIGGKTGVNLPEGKNLVGAVWQPVAVLCDTDTLSTLAPRELACGRGEMAKYALLEGEPDLSMLDLAIDEQVARCARIKAALVAADERESGQRVVLNYGHTLAHALEAMALETGAFELRHGEAVAVGLVFAALLSRRLGRIDDERVALHRRVVSGFDLPMALPEAAEDGGLLSFMARDKKSQHDLTFVLDGPAGIEVVREVAPADVLATLAEMRRADLAVAP